MHSARRRGSESERFEGQSSTGREGQQESKKIGCKGKIMPEGGEAKREKEGTRKGMDARIYQNRQKSRRDDVLVIYATAI
jgi:hypothetical protein